MALFPEPVTCDSGTPRVERTAVTLLADCHGGAMIFMGLIASLVLVAVFALSIDHGQNYSKQANLEGKLKNYAQYLAANYSYYQCDSTAGAACGPVHYTQTVPTAGASLWPTNTTHFAGVADATALNTVQTAFQADLQRDPQFGNNVGVLLTKGANANNMQTLTFYAAIPSANNFKQGTAAANCTITQGQNSVTASAGCVLTASTQVLDSYQNPVITGQCNTANPATCDGTVNANCCVVGTVAGYTNNGNSSAWTCTGSPSNSTNNQPCTGVSGSACSPSNICNTDAFYSCLQGTPSNWNNATGTWTCTNGRHNNATVQYCATTTTGNGVNMQPAASASTNGCAIGTLIATYPGGATCGGGAYVSGPDCIWSSAPFYVTDWACSLSNGAYTYGTLLQIVQGGTGWFSQNINYNTGSFVDATCGANCGPNCCSQGYWAGPGSSSQSTAGNVTTYNWICNSNYNTSFWDSFGSSMNTGNTPGQPSPLCSVSCTYTPGTGGGCPTYACGGLTVGPSNGVCAATPGNCTSGSYVAGSTYSSGGVTYWSCAGSNGGSTALCNSIPPINGQCNNNYPYSCLQGNPGSQVGTVSGSTTTYTWVCNSPNGGSPSPGCSTTSASSSAGACGTTTDTCTSGAASPQPATSTTSGATVTNSWNCNGPNGGSSVPCSSTNPPGPVNGRCGSSQDLCAAGTASGSGASWSCNGTNGGGNATCSWPVCGASSGCTTGSVTAGPTTTGSTTNWTCGTTNSDTSTESQACSNTVVSAGCGASSNTCTGGGTASNLTGGTSTCGGLTAFNSGTCTTGTFDPSYGNVVTNGDNNWWHCLNSNTNWTCTNGGSSVACSASTVGDTVCNAALPPICGPLTGNSPNSVGTCSVGSNLSGTTDNATSSTWSCTNWAGQSVACHGSDDVLPLCNNSVAYGCSPGTAISEVDDGTTKWWFCSATGNTSSQCNLHDPENAQCSTVPSGTQNPPVPECSVGTLLAGSVNTSNPALTTWTCQGAYNGVNASCSQVNCSTSCSGNSCTIRAGDSVPLYSGTANPPIAMGAGTMSGSCVTGAFVSSGQLTCQPSGASGVQQSQLPTYPCEMGQTAPSGSFTANISYNGGSPGTTYSIGFRCNTNDANCSTQTAQCPGTNVYSITTCN